MTDRRRASGQQDRPEGEDNPFAPPPEGQPDRPWQPRLPEGSEQGGEQDDQRQRWGSQWSRRQPGRGNGGFGEPPGDQDRRPGGLGGGTRWDPSDPAQRHARYSVLAGMWGVFGGLLGWEWLALLLGSLSLYWGISALRGGPKETPEARNRRVEALEGRPSPPAPPEPGPTGAAPRGARPQFAAAVSGIVLASAALLIVAATYTVQLVYKDYFDCVDEALTTPSRQACEELLPSQLRPILGEQD
ncbi:hypothetical protein [Streptomyces litchfieldiae]|uniref:Integral membrane protein n=1 Tax=Streptomyces litchfieldiae TaxID=3075543 RepID=A0ABU2N0Z4_9ACTN|nr:hypothetical protein [Streptomyces sp. DSM 44938]MDT0347262.1 hypothetical protein [Streptomyces sp. DSM 44938]